MSEPQKQNPAATAASVITAVGAALLGKFLGWAFGLQFALPLIVGLLTAGAVKNKMKPEAHPFAAGIGVHAAYLDRQHRAHHGVDEEAESQAAFLLRGVLASQEAATQK